MKTLLFLKYSLIMAMLSVFLFSCGGKGDFLSSTPPPCTTCSTTTKLVVNAVVAPGQVLYVGDSVKINWTTNLNATIKGTTGTSGSFMYGPLMTVGTTLSVSGVTTDGLSSDETTVNVSAYSTNNRLITKKVALYMAGSTASYYARTDALSTHYQGAYNSDTIFYKPDNTGLKKKVNGTTFNLVWYFQANEAGFGPAPNLPFNDPDYWNIELNDETKFQIYNESLDAFGPLPPGVKWRSTIVYSKKATL